MGTLDYTQVEKLLIKSHPELTEKWVQDRIAEDPSLLGLGDVVLKDRERLQPHAGRLDLLLQDAETDRRFEVEIQLGRTDESHIIRTIEYWDVERKRYPQYEHTAVIVAEDITSRFLNVIGLFNGVIPLMAIQMNAVKVGEQVGLMFMTVLDQLALGLVDDDEEVREVTDRAYWERRGTPTTVKMADQLFEIVREIDPGLELKYNKFYIGLARNGQPKNFVILKPQKNVLKLAIRMKPSEEIEAELENAGLDLMEYSNRDRRYRIRLRPDDIEKHRTVLSELFASAYREFGV